MRGSSGSTLVGSIGALVLYVAAASARVCQGRSDTCDTTSTPAATTSTGSAGNTDRCAQTGIPWRWASVTIAATRSAEQVRVHLDRGGVGAAGERGGDDEVGLVVDRLHPGHLAGRLALRDLPGARIVEEAGPGHQGGVVDVGAGDLTDPAGASEVADLPQVVGHVADRRDAAVDHLAQPGLGLDAVGRGGEVLVGVDQSRDHEPAGEVDHWAPSGTTSRPVSTTSTIAIPVDHERHAGRRRRSRAVEDRRVPVDDRASSPLLACHASHATEHLSRR